MIYNPEIHHRRSIRLKGYDYSQAGTYFVTICAWNRECLFGEIVDGEMRVNDAGRTTQKLWNESAIKFKNIELDEYVIMPNHMHGIIVINHVGAQFIAPAGPSAPMPIDCPALEGDVNQNINQGVINHAPTTTVGQIVRAFKARCTYAINQIRNSPGVPVWQRNYYEHIIRNEAELNKTREYIINNPLNWHDDENYMP